MRRYERVSEYRVMDVARRERREQEDEQREIERAFVVCRASPEEQAQNTSLSIDLDP